MKKVLSLILFVSILLGTFALSFAEGETSYPALGEGYETVYEKDNVRIALKKGRAFDSDYIVADIRIDDVHKLKKGFANGEFNKGTAMLSELATELGAILALSGDYIANNFKTGHVVKDGEVVRNSANPKQEICLIYEDGTMDIVKDTKENFAKAKEKGIWQSFMFGPGLIFNGKAIKKNNSKVGAANPRAAIGYYEKGHYCFVIVDGRSSTNKGMKMQQLVKFMDELGCKYAYNLDGGQSASLFFDGEILNNPYNGARKVQDCVYIEGESSKSQNQIIRK